MTQFENPVFRVAVPLLVLGIYFHAVYAFRNRSAWMRRQADWLKRIAMRDKDGIILFWALLCDFLAMVFWLLPDRLS